MINHFGKHTIFYTEMGWMGLVSTERGIFTSILPQQTQSEAESTLLSRLPFKSRLAGETFQTLENSVKAYFRGENVEIKCDLDWSWATPFQKKVLELVYAIPRGTYITYGEIACLIGLPGAARAVGSALASNMIPVIIPCHRVIRKGGALGGFTGAGLDVKSRLLFLEGIQLETK